MSENPFEIRISSDDGGKPSPKKLLKEIKEDLATQLELQRLLARLTRERYLGFIESGFTKEEALFLVKDR